MTSSYYKELDDAAKERYLQKLTFNGNLLPDPLDEVIRPYVFIKDTSLWPSVDFGDIFMYLVESECVYTREKFKNYKSLESYNYFHSGKVRNVIGFRNKNQDVCVLTCDVQASQTLKTHHRPWIIMSSNGLVHSGHCTCMAGLGEVCSHVGALLFALEVATREGPPSVTSLPCTWNKCAKKVEAKAVVEMVFSRNRKRKQRCKTVDYKMPSISAQNAFLKALQEQVPDAPFLTLLSDEGTSTASEGEMPKEKVTETNELISKENIQSLPQFLQELNKRIPIGTEFKGRIDFIIENCVFSTMFITNVERLTREQHKSSLWAHCRQGRLTASLFGRILRCTSRGLQKLLADIMQESRPFSSHATSHGQNTEELAKLKFKELFEQQHVNGEILKTGLLIDQQYGFLGATPDCMAICDCCDPALVEIKCPYKGIGRKIQDIEKKNFFLDENLNLKESHRIYDQVQGQMGIWSISRCYFVTYTDQDMNCQVIEYDDQYWGEQKLKLVNFFKEHVISKIL